MGENEHTMLEREVADIIISLLHRQGSDSSRRLVRRVPHPEPSCFFFPNWGRKRKRSLLSPAQSLFTHDSGDNGKPISITSTNALFPSSPTSISHDPALPPKSFMIGFADKELQAVPPVLGHCGSIVTEAYFNPKILESESLFWHGQTSSGDVGGSRMFMLPDLNMSVEQLVAVAADAELRQRQHVIYETARRRLAAADARRRRRELQKLKNSIAAGSPLCSRVR